ncbi:MAG: 2-keto-3-deoxygluconate kinase [Gammaproteobacteria bacterium RIFCSPHIGHO2_12_FULL_63_22]|nr:MAG: 2-keto-3-deoxygluconate kinase [Gammaproteobacteria bacterium RIFCSPHIGHO2_12_FULL_63_22]
MEIVCFGELLLRLGAPGREFLLQSPRLSVQVGGAEANVAVSLSRLGHQARMVGVVPAGPLGDAAAGELRRHGVDTAALRTGPGRMGLYFLQTGAGLRPSEVLYDRADSAFALADPAGYDWPALLAGADWLHLSGVTPALGQRTSAAALAAARAARKLGVKVSFDGNYRPKLWQAWQGDAPGILRELIAEADLVFADHRDMSVVLGIQFADEGPALQVQAAAREAFAAFPNLQMLASTIRTQHSVDHHALAAVMITRDGQSTLAPAMDLPGIVDRIGGGDAFAAGLLHALAKQGGAMTRKDDAMAALRFALAAAALKHSIPGDFNLASEADILACAGEARFDVKR